MRMEYMIALRQEESGSGISEAARGLLRQCFSDVDDKAFTIQCRARVYTLVYTVSALGRENAAAAVLNVSLWEEKPYHRAEVLERVNRQLLRNYDRTRYTVLLLYDEVSAYYSGRVYPLLTEWERGVRSLVARMLLYTASALLSGEKLSKPVAEALRHEFVQVRRGKSVERLYERALADVDVRRIEDFLMKREEDSAQLRQYEWALKTQGVDGDVSAAMREKASASVWKRFFEPECEEETLYNQLLYIQTLRERMQKGQGFTKNSCERLITVLTDMLRRIDGAREKLVSALDSPEKMQYALECLRGKIAEAHGDLLDKTELLLTAAAEETGFYSPVRTESLSPDALLSLIEGRLPAHYQIRLEDMEDE